MPAKISPALKARLAKVKLLLCDVDGILTDTSVYMGLDRELKRFNIRDGLGIMILRREGFKIGWVSNRPSPATTLRAQELEIDFLEQSKGDKVLKVENLLAKSGFKWDEVCYMGDDVVDCGVMKRAGVAASVADAIDEARAAAHYVTRVNGGQGAVREVIELLLKAQNRWPRIVAEYAA